MSDSSPSDALAAKQRANEADRLASIRRWVEYIRETPPSVWGEEQNRFVNAQVEAARESDLDADHKRRVQAFGEAMTESTDEESDAE
jgi:hypothetical protein